MDDLRLTDGVVVLDPLRSSDAEEHLAGEDEELQRWLSGGVSTLDHVVAYLRTVDEQWRNRGPIFHFAIRVAPRDELAGTIDLQFDQEFTGADQVNLAYGLYPQWRSLGLATRAVTLALAFLRDHTDARVAVIRTDRANHTSAAVGRRTGFVAVPPLDAADGMDRFERAL